MKLTADTKKFAAAFSAAARFRDGRARPILGYVHCRAGRDGTATLSAGNLEAAVQVNLNCEVAESGDGLLDGERVGRLLGLLDGERVEVECSENKCRVEKFSASTPNASEYILPKFSGEKVATIPAVALATAIDRTLFCVDEESTRYALGGVLIDADASALNFVATNGRSLSRFSVPTKAQINGRPIVHSRHLRAVRGLLGDGEASIRISNSDAVFDMPGVCASCRLVEGRFPAWRDLIPAKLSASFTVAVAPLLSAVKRVSLARDRDTKDILGDSGASLVASGGKLSLSMRGRMGGFSSSADLPIASIGDHGRADLDVDYLGDVLSALRGVDTVSVSLSEDGANFIDAGDDGLFLIMPLAKDR